MLELILFIICVVLISLKKSYYHLSVLPAEKRQSRQKHSYTVLKHIVFLNVLFESFLLGAFALFAISVAFSFETGWSFLIIFTGLAIIFFLLPKVRPTKPENKLAELLSGPFAYFLNKLANPIEKIESFLAKTNHKFHKTEPLSKKAIEELLKKQENIAPGGMKTDLKLALSGLGLNSQKVRYIMIRKQKARFVSIDEQVGPVLLSELHGLGRKIFPAEDENSEIAGVIRLDSLAELKSGGRAADVLNPQMVVVNKNDSVLAVIKRFVESASELVFAEDDNGGVVGIVYLEDVLKTLADAEEDRAEPLE